MSEIKLIKPTLRLKEEFLDMVQDFKNNSERPSPSTLNFDKDTISQMIQILDDNSKGIGMKKGHVENTTYWLVRNNRVIGGVNIRHRLNDYLLKYDGHLGGGIRPSDRNKGYATKMLALALAKTREMGMDKVLITCNKGNIASEKTIIKNGGVFESEETEDNGNVVRRFWIMLK
ncbi:GNAT family N-acetyltransferase [Haloplasma contractile]|uniref:Acetyltransferase GNAT family protein n=1 Tax=Haloplasma contractile SSD-17B TaxID=1033810 RepID=F7Q0Z8_9MOLU|nr:GNAT family N-acetyltransferase [Haloplasma contractile]ERJ11359.1 Acetyltransferase GNAT family protein [Haloplasma contractile SSD-17B]